jgi:ketosteroid isomerase-like protein
MGQAREIMDRLTDAVMSGDRETLERLYAPDAVGEAPDAPRLEGNVAIVDYLLAFPRAFPDASFESATKYESGDTAIDEGYLLGTHTEPFSTPDGDLPPTGRSVRMRECDIITVANGVAVSHHFYYDRLDFMSQLGLLESDTGAAAVPQPRDGADRSSEATAR